MEAGLVQRDWGGLSDDGDGRGADVRMSPVARRRLSVVIRLLEARNPYPVVASILGRSAATATRVAKSYGHIGQKALRDAVDGLGGEEVGAVSPREVPKD